VKVKPGDILTFKACTWDAGWEFDAPCIVYEPLKYYCFEHPEAAIESLCDDLCIGEVARESWHPDGLREFKWRGWNPNGFARRKNARHVTLTAEFYTDGDGLAWREVAVKAVSP